jgi:PKD repeat protein
VTSWLWDFDDGITSAVQNPVHSYEDAGEYEVTLTVTSAEGCKATAKKTLGIITGLENLSNGKLEIYPNPVTIERVQLNVSEPLRDGELRLFTSHGVLIRTESLRQGQQSFDVSTLPNGIYILKIGDSSNITTRKVVISR